MQCAGTERALAACVALLAVLAVVVWWLLDGGRSAHTARCAGGSRGSIFYERDRAGWNNVRLQFESLCVLAHLTGRTLVIPPASKIDHCKVDFSEEQVYDLGSLGQYVDLRFSGAPRPEGCAAASSVDDALRASGDVFLSEAASRIQHFQCLRLSADEIRRANRVVFHGLVPSNTLREKCAKMRAKLDLGGDYAAVHVRRGDFQEFASGTQRSAVDMARILEEKLPADLPVLIASDGGKEYIDEVQTHTSLRLCTALSEADGTDSDVVLSVLEQLLCAQAVRFLGTHLSTFSTGIFQLRQQEARRNHRIVVDAQVLTGEPVLEGVEGGVGERCFARATRF